MNKAMMLGGAVALGLGGLVTAPLVKLPAARAQGEAVWLNNYGAAQAAARQAGKPIFLVFR